MNDDPARARFMAIQAVRLSGVALVVFGMLVISRRVSFPIEAGYILVVFGILDALIMPTVLARRWKSPPP